MRVQPFNHQPFTAREICEHAKFAVGVPMRMIELVMFKFQYPQAANAITRERIVGAEAE